MGQRRPPLGRLTSPLMPTPPTLVVLAAGLARRYGGCKPLAPAGPGGEAVIDLSASDAIAAGFGDLVLVVHPETGPAIRYHVERTWPSSVPVSFAEQRVPLGTTHAVLAARSLLGPDRSFAIANADDVYGQGAMGQLADQLASPGPEHAMVGFRLRNTVVTSDPVTRGVCEVDADHHLIRVDERRQVSRHDDGDHFTALDGVLPDKLSGDLLVSVNLWGFRPTIWERFTAAMDASGLDEDAIVAALAAGETPPKAEVLLPEVVGTMVAEGAGAPVRVLATDSHCIGVTHAKDLAVVRAQLSRQVALGIRPDRLWGGVT
jgi:MobA-like NTP transferase domain